jgi:hypothetical protein
LPLPLSLPKAEGIARAELDKWLPGNSGWEVTEVRLERLRGDDKWYFAVRLAPEVNKPTPGEDSFVVMLNLSGEPGPIELAGDK